MISQSLTPVLFGAIRCVLGGSGAILGNDLGIGYLDVEPPLPATFQSATAAATERGARNKRIQPILASLLASPC